MAPHILDNTYYHEPNTETDPHNVNEFNRLWLILHGQGIVGPIGSRYYKNELYWYLYNNGINPDSEVTPHEYLMKHMSCFYIEDMEQPIGYRLVSYDIKEFDRIWKQQAKKGERDTEYGGEYHGQLAEFLSDVYTITSPVEPLTPKVFLSLK